MFLFFVLSSSREPRTLYIDPNSDGDCFETPCAMKTATLVVRAADTIHFSSATIRPGSYPSEFSDLFIQLTLMNTTVVSHGTIVDGRYLAGDMLWQITSHPHFTWTLFHNWTFVHFTKPIATRQYSWSSAPFVVFRDCVFEDSTADLFVMKGGTMIFENCIFKNVSGRPLKAISENIAEFIDCVFDDCTALFFHGSDAMFTNCMFKNMKGQRGGAIYASKTTLHVERCDFINCKADINGGSIYVRDLAEIFESDIINSCFYNSNAKYNGSAVYSYLSYISIDNSCFNDESSIMYYEGNITMLNNEYNDCKMCLTRPKVETIGYQFTPTDTFKWWHLDDLNPGSTIVIDDDDEEL